MTRHALRRLSRRCYLFAVLAGIVLAILLAASVARADEWQPTDTVLLTAALATTAVDWIQTSTPRIIEYNPIMGRYPTHARINGYFAAVAVGQGLVAGLLPSKWRRLVLSTVVFVEVGATTHNAIVGVGFGRPW